MMLGLLSLLLAADPSAYPYVAEVQAPVEGVVGVMLPPEATGRWGEDLNRTMLYLSASGQPVPYTTVSSRDRLTLDHLSTFLRPQGDGVYHVSEFSRPVEALELKISAGSFVWRVQVQGQGGWRDAGLVWKMQGGSERLVVFVPRGTGPFVVKLTSLDGSAAELGDLDGLEVAAGTPPLHQERVELGEPVVTEGGTARYEVRLPGIRDVRALKLEVKDDLYRRFLRVGSGSTWIERVKVGDYDLEQTAIEGLSIRGDRLTMEIDTNRGDPLEIPAVEVYSATTMLLAKDAGPGQLYLGSLEPAEAYDLTYMRNALLQSGKPGSMGALTPNDAWVAPPTREGVDGPTVVLDDLPQRWEREILGDPGWVRVSLDASLLGRSNWDLRDLRVVDPQDRVVPYLLRPGEEVGAPEDLVFTRKEVGTITELRAPVSEGRPVKTLVLETDRLVFERSVEVIRDRGATVQSLRYVNWQGTERGHRLALNLDQDIGSELMIRIHNGENPPIPVQKLSISRPSRELLVRLPEGGAKLVYGARRVAAPDYDLSLLADQVLRMPVGAATLGPEKARGKPALTGTDQAASAFAMLMLAGGLVGMTWRVLRGAKEQQAAD